MITHYLVMRWRGDRKRGDKLFCHLYYHLVDREGERECALRLCFVSSSFVFVIREPAKCSEVTLFLPTQVCAPHSESTSIVLTKRYVYVRKRQSFMEESCALLTLTVVV